MRLTRVRRASLIRRSPSENHRPRGPAIGELRELRQLDLRGNPLATLPASLAAVAIAGGRVAVESLGAELIVDSIYRNSSIT